jgi:hypothetical protein
VDVQGKIMNNSLARITKWLFLGHGMQGVIVNMASVFGSLYLVLFLVIITLNLPEGYSLALIVCEYICAVVYIVAFVVSHSERGAKYFDVVKTAVALNSMLICGFLYTTPDGKIWSFLVPFFIVLISQYRLGLFLCLVYFCYMIFIEIFLGPREMWIVLRYYLTFLLQVALVCTYEILRISYEKKLFKEKEFARSLLGHYNEVKDLYESLSILHHDLKYHLKITDELLQSGKAQEAGQYLAAVKEQIPEENMHYYCLNHAVNALLSSYAKRCKELDIKYDVNVIMPEILSVPDYDICTVLGNLLENAFEACQKLEKGREIKITIKTDDSRLAIMAKNTFDGVVSEKNGKIASTKKGGGLGLPGIKAIVDSHDGHMLTEWDETTFTAYLILNVESDS